MNDATEANAKQCLYFVFLKQTYARYVQRKNSGAEKITIIMALKFSGPKV